MTRPLKLVLPSLLALLAAPLIARAQSIPAQVGTNPGVGFQLPRVGGSLTYALSASELLSNGLYNSNGVLATTSLSGDVAYVSKSSSHPFSAIYSGGVLAANSGQPTTTYQSLSFSQVFSSKRWNFAVADSVSYLPQTPTSGLSGIPGVGDLGVDPVAVGPTSGIGILTVYGPRVSNAASASVSRSITAHISAQASGNFSLQRFIGDNAALGLDSTGEGGSAGLSYHLDARNIITGNYNYSRFSYSGDLFSFTTQGATVDYTRNWSRRLSTDIYAGPQIITGSQQAIGSTSIQIAAGGSASYQGRSTGYTLTYSRGVNNGSGVISGSFSDNLILAAHRQFGRSWAGSASVGYTHFTSLPNVNFGTYSGHSVSAGGQVSRALGRRFSCFGSYNVQNQSTSGTFNATNAFSGVYQIVGFGVTYSPAAVLLGR